MCSRQHSSPLLMRNSFHWISPEVSQMHKFRHRTHTGSPPLNLPFWLRCDCKMLHRCTCICTHRHINVTDPCRWSTLYGSGWPGLAAPLLCRAAHIWSTGWSASTVENSEGSRPEYVALQERELISRVLTNTLSLSDINMKPIKCLFLCLKRAKISSLVFKLYFRPIVEWHSENYHS